MSSSNFCKQEIQSQKKYSQGYPKFYLVLFVQIGIRNDIFELDIGE